MVDAGPEVALRSIWRVQERLVVQRGDQFWVIDPTGQIVERHAPERINGSAMVTFIEYRVRGDELVRNTCIATLSGEDDDDEVVVAGLLVVEDPETRHFVQVVLDDDMVAAEERRLRESPEN